MVHAQPVTVKAEENHEILAAAEAVPPCHGEHPAGAVDAAHQVPMTDAEGDDSPESSLPCCMTHTCQCASFHVSANVAPVVVAALFFPDRPATFGGRPITLKARIVELFKPPI